MSGLSVLGAGAFGKSGRVVAQDLRSTGLKQNRRQAVQVGEQGRGVGVIEPGRARV